MSNWFENNATKSIITYTLVVIAATWAFSTFILEDSKLVYVKSQLETQKTISDQYKVKVDILQKDIEKLQAENTEYKSWLEKEGKVVPSIFIAQNLTMKEEIKNLKTKLEKNSLNPALDQTLKAGKAYIDYDLDVSVALDKVAYGNKATIFIKLPNSDKNSQFNEIKAGDIVKFEKDNKKYKITFKELSFAQDIVNFSIDPVS